MSYVPITAATSAAVAAARKLRDEEENMTPYEKDSLDGWEFKIVRSYTGKFKDYKFVQQLCEEEAKAGWEMLEKFDNNRIRFKRKTDNKANDRFLDFDPYRTHVGFGSGQKVAIVIGITVLLLGLIVLIGVSVNR